MSKYLVKGYALVPYEAIVRAKNRKQLEEKVKQSKMRKKIYARDAFCFEIREVGLLEYTTEK